MFRALCRVGGRRNDRGGRDRHTREPRQLDHLLAKRLLVRRQHAHAPTRLHMLETIRAYATERLAMAAADEQAVRERHYRYHLALAERAGTA